MDSILRAAFMYVFLLIIIRISGTRTLSEMTTFDFILMLIIGDSTQQAITSTDYSIINAVTIIITFIVLDLLLNIVKTNSSFIDQLLEGTPLVLINNGTLRKKVMQRAEVDESDILESARKSHGLERLDQIKYAILEKDGDITIVPR